MIVHRDYRENGLSIIKIYDDRIEFYNPGNLFGDLNIKQLLIGNYSPKTRNRAIANIFKEAGIIERYSSGISRIVKAFKLHSIKKPEEFAQGFRVTLVKNDISGGIIGVDGGDSGGANIVFEYLQKNPNQNAKIISKNLNIPLRTIQRLLKQLKDDGKIIFQGSKKTGGYVITRNNQ